MQSLLRQQPGKHPPAKSTQLQLTQYPPQFDNPKNQRDRPVRRKGFGLGDEPLAQRRHRGLGGGWDIGGSLLCMLRMYLCMQAENSAQKSI